MSIEKPPTEGWRPVTLCIIYLFRFTRNFCLQVSCNSINHNVRSVRNYTIWAKPIYTAHFLVCDSQHDTRYWGKVRFIILCWKLGATLLEFLYDADTVVTETSVGYPWDSLTLQLSADNRTDNNAVPNEEVIRQRNTDLTSDFWFSTPYV